VECYTEEKREVLGEIRVPVPGFPP